MERDAPTCLAVADLLAVGKTNNCGGIILAGSTSQLRSLVFVPAPRGQCRRPVPALPGPEQQCVPNADRGSAAHARRGEGCAAPARSAWRNGRRDNQPRVGRDIHTSKRCCLRRGVSATCCPCTSVACPPSTARMNFSASLPHSRRSERSCCACSATAVA